MKTIYQVDTFTSSPFSGNPAGVMLVEAEMSKESMQQIASEMNVSETAFLYPTTINHFKIRYFTPLKEIPLCGHATMASAHILYEKGVVKIEDVVFFHAQDTILEIRKTSDSLDMKFPSYSIAECEPPKNFEKIAGFKPIEFYTSQYNWKIAVAPSEKAIKTAQPDFSALQNAGIDALMITSQSQDKETDFIVRCFVPGMGINEDPATGSAQCALGPLWSKKLGKNALNSIQWSKRKGQLKVTVYDDHVVIRGKALTIFEVKLLIND